MAKVVRGFSLILFLIFSWLTGNEACGSTPNFAYAIRSHSLKIEIDPHQQLIRAEDQLRIDITEKGAKTLSFLLHSSLKITEVMDPENKKRLPWSEASVSESIKRLDVSIQAMREPQTISFSYEGRIYDPIVKEKGLQFVRGDQTRGLISEEGVYLASPSRWYPDKPESMAAFRVEAKIADPFRIVTQGELLSEERKAGFWKSRWSCVLPTQSLTLVAGKYLVKTRSMNGVRISTYFFPEDDRLSDVFLNATEEYLKIYSGLLGPYPYKKFDIVQNFFSSGYGFPSFTLLAPEAIRQGKEFLRPGALDHEIVHSWWGHSVSVKPGTGNWAEALTTYCTNYYFKELKMGEETARKHRLDVMQKYAIQVSPSKDYPFRQFEGKEDEVDGQIGYGKGSMVFHMLRESVGKDLFFVTLRNLSRQYAGKQASWKDIERVFEGSSGKRLNRFFTQWLDRSGGSQLKLENVSYRVITRGYEIEGEVVQEGDLYELALPLEVDEGGEKRSVLLDVSKEKTPFSIEVPRLPLALTIDPAGHLFRRLYAEEIIPCLNAFLEDPEKIFVLPDGENEESRKTYSGLAKSALERKGGKILSAKELTEKEVLHSSLMLLGDSWKATVFSKLFVNLPDPIQIIGSAFFLKGDKVAGEEASLLFTLPHPHRPGRWVTVYQGVSATALSRARFIFFYGWDSYLLFERGKPVERGGFAPRASFLTHDFRLNQRLDTIDGERGRK